MSAVKTIGIIGGGQLGLMIIEQAHLLGARTICLDPAEDAPAFKISDERIVGRFDDPAALEELCRRSDVVTYEFENVPGDLLVALEQKYNIKQGFRPLFDSQDRLREKSNACDHGLKTPAFMAVDDEESLHRAIARIGYPCVLKTRTLGYDGHGQAVLRGEADLAKARELLAVPCILEEFVPFDFEASVVLVSDGERVICFPVGRNIHKDGILDLCIVPAEMPDQVRERMVSQSKRFMRDCGYRGDSGYRIFREGRRGLFQRNGAAPAQQRTLDHRGFDDQSVPGAVPLPARYAPRRAAAEGPYRDEKHPGTGSGAGRGACPGESPRCVCPYLRQDRFQAQAQDGTRDFRRCDRRGVCRQVGRQICEIKSKIR